jgi:hypothetical protein
MVESFALVDHLSIVNTVIEDKFLGLHSKRQKLLFSPYLSGHESSLEISGAEEHLILKIGCCYDDDEVDEDLFPSESDSVKFERLRVSTLETKSEPIFSSI